MIEPKLSTEDASTECGNSTLYLVGVLPTFRLYALFRLWGDLALFTALALEVVSLTRACTRCAADARLLETR